MSQVEPLNNPAEAIESFFSQFKDQLRVEISRVAGNGQEVAARQIIAAQLGINERMIRNYLKPHSSVSDISFRTLYLAVRNLGFLLEHDGVIFGRMA